MSEEEYVEIDSKPYILGKYTFDYGTVVQNQNELTKIMQMVTKKQKLTNIPFEA